MSTFTLTRNNPWFIVCKPGTFLLDKELRLGIVYHVIQWFPTHDEPTLGKVSLAALDRELDPWSYLVADESIAKLVEEKRILLLPESGYFDVDWYEEVAQQHKREFLRFGEVTHLNATKTAPADCKSASHLYVSMLHNSGPFKFRAVGGRTLTTHDAFSPKTEVRLYPGQTYMIRTLMETDNAAQVWTQSDEFFWLDLHWLRKRFALNQLERANQTKEEG